MKSVLPVLLILIFCCETGFSEAFCQTYEFGTKAYAVNVSEETESGKVVLWTDIIQFGDGGVSADFSRQYGFSNGNYTVSTETVAGLTTYYISAMGYLKTGETLEWTIAITGEFIAGEAERSDTGAIYVFDGRLK